MLKKYIYSLLAFIIIFNNTVYATNTIALKLEDGYENSAYINYSQNVLRTHTLLINEIVKKANKIELTYREVIALEKARNTGITYLVYPGSAFGVDGNIGIEKFNADVISRVYDIDIELVTINQIDDELENSFETSIELLEKGVVDLAGKFKYFSEEELPNNLVSSDYYAKEYIYDVFLANNTNSTTFDDIDLLYNNNENYAVTHNLSFLNESKLEDDKIEVLHVEEVYDKLESGEIDYFVGSNYEMSKLSEIDNIMVRDHRDTSIYPNNIIVADKKEYNDLITAINKIYTQDVLSIYDEYSELLNNYNKLYAYMLKGSIYNNIPTINVGVMDVPSIIEKVDNRWTGYIIEILEEINKKFDVDFIYHDYTDVGYDQLVNDFMDGKIDMIPITTEAMIMENEWGITRDNVGIVPLREDMHLELFYNDDTNIKYYEQIPLKKIGIYRVTEPLIYRYIEMYIKGYDNVIFYDDLDRMFIDLLNKEIDFVFELEGTDKYLKDKGSYVFNTKKLEVSDDFYALVRLEVLDDGEYLHAKLTNLVNLVDVERIKTNELYFDIDETYISTISNQIDFWLASLLVVVILNIIAVYFIFMYKNKNDKLLREVNRTYESTEFSNRRAFIDDVVISESKNIICTFVKISNLRKIQDYYRNESFNELFEEFLKRLSSVVRDEKLTVYFLQDHEFIITMPSTSKENFNKIIKNVMAQFDNSYEINNIEEKLRFNMLSINMKELVNNEDALYYFNYFISSTVEGEAYVNHSFLDNERQKRFRNNREVIKILTSNDLSSSIRLKFRPIINIRKNKIIGAQAEIFLYVKGKLVSSEEYKQLATMSGKEPIIDFETIMKIKKIRDKFVEVGLIDEDFIFSVPSSEEMITNHNLLKSEDIKDIKFNFIQLELREELLDNRNLVSYIKLLSSLDFKISISEFSAGHSSMEKIDMIKLENIIFKNSFMDSDHNLEVSFKIKNLIDELGYKVIYTNVVNEKNLNKLKEKNIRFVIGDFSNEAYTLSKFKEIIKEYNSLN